MYFVLPLFYFSANKTKDIGKHFAQPLINTSIFYFTSPFKHQLKVKLK